MADIDQKGSLSNGESINAHSDKVETRKKETLKPSQDLTPEQPASKVISLPSRSELMLELLNELPDLNRNLTPDDIEKLKTICQDLSQKGIGASPGEINKDYFIKPSQLKMFKFMLSEGHGSLSNYSNEKLQKYVNEGDFDQLTFSLKTIQKGLGFKAKEQDGMFGKDTKAAIAEFYLKEIEASKKISETGVKIASQTFNYQEESLDLKALLAEKPAPALESGVSSLVSSANTYKLDVSYLTLPKPQADSGFEVKVKGLRTEVEDKPTLRKEVNLEQERLYSNLSRIPSPATLDEKTMSEVSLLHDNILDNEHTKLTKEQVLGLLSLVPNNLNYSTNDLNVMIKVLNEFNKGENPPLLYAGRMKENIEYESPEQKEFLASLRRKQNGDLSNIHISKLQKYKSDGHLSPFQASAITFQNHFNDLYGDSFQKLDVDGIIGPKSLYAMELYARLSL